MTRFVSVLFLLVGLVWANSSFAQDAVAQPVADPDAAVITFDNENFDFGTVKQGDIVNHTFVFTNTGKKDLVLSSVKPGCGCTTPKWTNTPVKPGEKGQIEVSFNTAGKMGYQTKNVAVTYNGEPAMKQVFIKGNIASTEPAPVENQAPAPGN